jgi:hypothetical protein
MGQGQIVVDFLKWQCILSTIWSLDEQSAKQRESSKQQDLLR